MDWATIGTWVGAIATILGFAAAIWQIRKATSAAEATARAILSTSKKLAVNQAVVVLPQLRRFAIEIEVHARDNNRAGTIESLGQWQRNAAEMRGLLVAMGQQGRPISSQLVRTLQRTSRAREALLDESKSCIDATMLARQAVESAMMELEALFGAARFSIPGSD